MKNNLGIQIDRCNFVGNNTAISVSKGSHLKIKDTSMVNNEVGLEVRDVVSPRVSQPMSIQQNHYGSGDNIAGDKIKKENINEVFDIPLWLKYLVAIATVIGTVAVFYQVMKI